MNAQPDIAKLKATKPGTYAGITYTTPDLEKGAAYFHHLNYKEVKRTEDGIYLTDGSVLLKLEEGTNTGYRITYYSDEPQALSHQLLEKGLIVENSVISAGKCDILIRDKESGIPEPNGTSFMTMSPADYGNESKYPNEKCGAYGEWAIPVTDLEERVAWWEQLGFEASMKKNEPYPHAIMTDGLLIVGLHQTSEFTEPTLTYFAPNMEPKVKALRQEGLEGIKTIMGNTDKNVELHTPGGQKIFLFSMGM